MQGRTTNQELQAIKETQNRVQERVAAQFLEVITKTGALTLDFPTFIGGTLEVIAKIQSGSKEMEDWQQAGQKFLGILAKKSKPPKKPNLSAKTNARV